MESDTGSCLTHRELVTIADAYNSSSSSSSIPRSIFRNKQALWRALAERFRSHCGRGKQEHCWVQKVPDSHAVRSIRHDGFRPAKPSAWYANPNEWLNTYDILLVMKQYEKKYRQRFRFVGVFPRDFATLVVVSPTTTTTKKRCVSEEMCDASLGRKETSLGFVFNHDAHNQPGSHWVALFCCMDPGDPKYGAFYYDSVGREMKDEVMRFATSMKSRSPDPSRFSIRHNTIRHQFGNTECGMFAMHFLISCLEDKAGRTVTEVVSQKGFGTDESLTRLRDVLYTPSSSKVVVTGGGGEGSTRSHQVGGLKNKSPRK